MKRLLIVAASAVWFVVMMALVGCGEGELDEIKSQTTTLVNDPFFAGYSMTGGGVYKNISATWVEPQFGGLNGDGYAQHLNIGQVENAGNSGACFARVGSIFVMGSTHQLLSLYGNENSDGQLVGPAVSGHTYKVVQWVTGTFSDILNWQITDQTAGQIVYTASRVRPGDCQFFDASGGWEIERPVWGGTRRPLANFGATQFTKVLSLDKFGVNHPIGGDNTTKLQMVNPATGHTLAQVGDPFADSPGQGFGLTWITSL